MKEQDINALLFYMFMYCGLIYVIAWLLACLHIGIFLADKIYTRTIVLKINYGFPFVIDLLIYHKSWWRTTPILLYFARKKIQIF